MTDHAKDLKDMQPKKEFLVAIDSDGCVFDAMGIKQRECFCPMMIAYFDLQPVAEAARECKDFADLFSKTRGSNRHLTMARILTELLPSHPMVKSRKFNVPQFRHYCEWATNPNSLLSNDGLKIAVGNATDPQAKEELQRGLTWSIRVNELIAEIVKNIPPFPFVRESLEKIIEKADIIVCSSTPKEALEREWAEHDVAKYANVIAGQEMGTKAQHLAIAAQKYDKENILMIGDAPGDFKAAHVNGLSFYPINPGKEDMSWKRFYEEGFDKFISGAFAGEYQKKIVDEFDALLPEHPTW